jgi:hypothetical protein
MKWRNEMDDFSDLTPEQRALLEGVSNPDLPIAGLPPIYTVQSNSRCLLNLPELGAANPYVHGAMAGGFVVPNLEGRVFIPSPPGFTFAIFAFSKEFAVFEILPDNKGLRFVESHPEMPEGAGWKDSPNGRICRDSKGRVAQEARNAFMKVEETGQLGFYRFNKTALPIGRDLTNRAQVLSVEGLKGVKGCVLGRYRMTTFLEKKDTCRWFLPSIEYLGKLGKPNGPSLAAVLELAELRNTFLAGLPPMLEIEGPPEPPAPPASSSIDEAPAPTKYDGPDGDDPTTPATSNSNRDTEEVPPPLGANWVDRAHAFRRRRYPRQAHLKRDHRKKSRRGQGDGPRTSDKGKTRPDRPGG